MRMSFSHRFLPRLWTLAFIGLNRHTNVSEAFAPSLHHIKSAGTRRHSGSLCLLPDFHSPIESMITLSNPPAIPAALEPSLLVSSNDLGEAAAVSTAVKSPLSLIMDHIMSEDRPFQYLFMLPTMTLIATCCQLAGIGGAALLSPVLLLIFPLLGADYPLASAASAIASALMTEVFGFASGLSGYWRRGLVDWGVAIPFLLVSVPSALVGALLESSIASNTTLLRGVYAVLMISLAAFLLLSEKPEEILEEECDVLEDDEQQVVRTKKAADGTSYSYLQTGASLSSTSATASGSVLTGLLGVGIGEVVLPQLVRRNCMPLPIAAGTSVAVVVTTALTAAVVQFLALAQQLTTTTYGADKVSLLEGFVDVIPWPLVQYTIPGALIGGQIAPYVASKKLLEDETIETFAAALFAFIGVAFGWKAVTG